MFERKTIDVSDRGREREMTARSMYHRDPRKCYRIILIAQRIWSKELERKKTKKETRTYTRTRRRSVS